MRLAVCLSLSISLAAQSVAPTTHELVIKVEQSHLRRSVERLAAFGTRHTLSETDSDTRGIGAARRWLAEEADGLTQLPGSRLVTFEDRFTAPAGPRIPKPVEMVSVGLRLPGMDLSRSKEALVIVGHYDSRASDVMDAVGDAPGAVDDASGVAMAFEMARVMAAEQLAITIYFVAVAGEEQGLVGSTHLASRLKAEGVHVLGALAVDTVGNTTLSNGGKDDTSVRLFSEGVPSWESDRQRKVRESLGAENDGISREFARYLKRFGQKQVEGLDCLVMLRQDRVGRSGDHLAFTREGFAGARITETFECFDRQHQTPRVEGTHAFGDSSRFFDPGYCAKVTRMLVGAFRQLAMAPAAPEKVVLGGAMTPDVKLRWTLPTDPRIKGVLIYRRRADGVAWEQTLPFGRVESVLLPNAGTDNHVYAVATVDVLGNESLPAAPSKVE